MAQNDLTMFEDFAQDLGDEKHNLGVDIIKVALIDNTLQPLANIATPTWSDYSVNEMVTGNGYTTGGEEIVSDVWEKNGTLWRLDGDNVGWIQNGLGFTTCHWAIVYNTISGSAICFIQMGTGIPGSTSPISLQAGDININWHADGIFTVSA